MKQFPKSGLCVFALAILSSTVSAQVVPKSVSYRRGTLYNAAGDLIRDADAIQYIGEEVYKATYVGARKQFRTGQTLSVVGARER